MCVLTKENWMCILSKKNHSKADNVGAFYFEDNFIHDISWVWCFTFSQQFATNQPYHCSQFSCERWHTFARHCQGSVLFFLILNSSQQEVTYSTGGQKSRWYLINSGSNYLNQPDYTMQRYQAIKRPSKDHRLWKREAAQMNSKLLV